MAFVLAVGVRGGTGGLSGVWARFVVDLADHAGWLHARAKRRGTRKRLLRA